MSASGALVCAPPVAASPTGRSTSEVAPTAPQRGRGAQLRGVAIPTPSGSGQDRDGDRGAKAASPRHQPLAVLNGVVARRVARSSSLPILSLHLEGTGTQRSSKKEGATVPTRDITALPASSGTAVGWCGDLGLVRTTDSEPSCGWCKPMYCRSSGRRESGRLLLSPSRRCQRVCLLNLRQG